MTDHTEIIEKTPQVQPDARESRLCGMSLRGFIALIVVTTVCAMSLGKIKVVEPLYTLAGLVVGFYFGQNQKQKVQQ